MFPVQVSRRLLPHCGPLDLSLLLLGTAKLKARPPQGWVEDLLAASLPLMGAFTPQVGLGVCVRARACVCVCAGRGIVCVYVCVCVRTRVRACVFGEGGEAPFASARVSWRVNVKRLVMVDAAVWPVHPLTYHPPPLTAQDMTNSLWSLVTLRHRPPGVWLDTLTAAATRVMHKFKPQVCGSSVWTLCVCARACAEFQD